LSCGALVRRAGAAWDLAKAGPASGARERTLELYETGIRRSCGRARGLWWLQKSTSGAWSKAEMPWV